MSASARKKQQYVIFAFLLAIILGGLFFIGKLMNNSQAAFVSGSLGQTGNVDETLIADRTSAASPEMSWINTSQKEIEALKKEIEAMRRDAEKQIQLDKDERQKILDEAATNVVKQQGKINALETALKTTKAQTASNGSLNANTGTLRTAALDQNLDGDFVRQTGGRLNPLAQAGGQTTASQGGATVGVSQSGQQSGGLGPDGQVMPPAFGVSFALEPKPESATKTDGAVRRKSLGSYLPAGSYAPAVVISGVDASTGVVSQDNPVPVTLRVSGPATTAGQGTTRGQQVNITGCMILGSARGDLSSERVYVRLTKMTCLHGDDVLEANIAGFMAGSGKAGVRGKVVSREGNLTTNAAIAGALQGLANGLSGAGEAVAGSENAQIQDVLKSAGLASVSEGTATAAQTLSEYYIKRAEQYQPVVSLYGGSEVEIVFLEGVDFSEGEQ